MTGAGISAESGLKTFRDSNGLWENHRLEDVSTPEAFSRNPDLVYRFYNARRRQLISDDVKPNEAHIALAKLEAATGVDVVIVTQNVDNLHEQGGSKNLLHMHGELLSARCTVSGESFFIDSDFDQTTFCQCCERPNPIRPNIVWFGEVPFHMDAIQQYLRQCDLFVSIGTSGSVYPAAGFVQEATFAGATTVELNLEPSDGSRYFDQGIYGKAGDVVPKFVEEILANNDC